MFAKTCLLRTKNQYIFKSRRAPFFLEGIVELKCGFFKFPVIFLLLFFGDHTWGSYKTNTLGYLKTPYISYQFKVIENFLKTHSACSGEKKSFFIKKRGRWKI